MAQVTVPDDASPIQLEPLDLEFSRHVLEVVGRAHILLPVQEPANRVSLDPYVDCVRLQPLRLRRDNDSISLGASRLIAQPLFGARQVTSEPDWIAGLKLSKSHSGRIHIEIKHFAYELAQRFRTERPH